MECPALIPVFILQAFDGLLASLIKIYLSHIYMSNLDFPSSRPPLLKSYSTFTLDMPLSPWLSTALSSFKKLLYMWQFCLSSQTIGTLESRDQGVYLLWIPQSSKHIAGYIVVLNKYLLVE